nr:hypothetical protein CFP56_30460 [Quercus suber]
MAHPTGPGHEVGAYHHPSAPAHCGSYLPPYGSGYPTAPPYGSGYWSASAYGGGTGWYPTGPAYGGYHAPGYVPYIYTLLRRLCRCSITRIVLSFLELWRLGLKRWP